MLQVGNFKMRGKRNKSTIWYFLLSKLNINLEPLVKLNLNSENNEFPILPNEIDNDNASFTFHTAVHVS